MAKTWLVKDVNVNAKKIMKDMTVNVRLDGIESLRIRIWIGKQLMVLACKIIGCGCNITKGKE